jgi:hypothetical protein
MTTIYRSTTPGDETSKPVKTKLTEDEAALKLTVDATRRGITRLEWELKDANDYLAVLKGQCKHHAFSDEPGFLYTSRTCAVCGANMGLV